METVKFIGGPLNGDTREFDVLYPEITFPVLPPNPRIATRPDGVEVYLYEKLVYRRIGKSSYYLCDSYPTSYEGV